MKEQQPLAFHYVVILVLSCFLLLILSLNLWNISSFSSRVPLTIKTPTSTSQKIFEFDLCGIKGGDESSCSSILTKIGIQKTTPSLPDLREWLLRYIQIHHKIMDPFDDSVPKKYIVLDDEVEQGLGNRFQVIVSVFLFALLTDRALLINWPRAQPIAHWNKEELVGMPAISELLDSPGFDWDYSHYRNQSIFRCDDKKEFEQPYGKGKNTWFQCCNGKEFAKQNGFNVNDEHGCFNISRLRGIEPEFQCDDLKSVYSNQTVVYFKTWDYFVPNILVNPFYRAEWQLILSERGSNIFTPLGNFLLRPIASIQNRIQLFKEQNFGAFTLGLQIRRIGINKLNSFQEDLFLQCAQEVELEFIGNLSSTQVKWFLATDNYKTRERLKLLYGDKLIYQEAVIGRSDSEGVIAGLIDMLLLSECDEMILSAASTYGKISIGLKGKPYRYVNRKNVCRINESWQPCFFQFQPLFCLGKHSISEQLQHQISDCDHT